MPKFLNCSCIFGEKNSCWKWLQWPNLDALLFESVIKCHEFQSANIPWVYPWDTNSVDSSWHQTHVSPPCFTANTWWWTTHDVMVRTMFSSPTYCSCSQLQSCKVQPWWVPIFSKRESAVGHPPGARAGLEVFGWVNCYHEKHDLKEWLVFSMLFFLAPKVGWSMSKPTLGIIPSTSWAESRKKKHPGAWNHHFDLQVIWSVDVQQQKVETSRRQSLLLAHSAHLESELLSGGSAPKNMVLAALVPTLFTHLGTNSESQKNHILYHFMHWSSVSFCPQFFQANIEHPTYSYKHSKCSSCSFAGRTLTFQKMMCQVAWVFAPSGCQLGSSTCRPHVDPMSAVSRVLSYPGLWSNH